jgi:DNA-binding response OmpR family regulator
LQSIATKLASAGYSVARASLDSEERGGTEALCRAFDGRPPDLLLADLSRTGDMLPLRHASRLLRLSWGDEMPMPARLVLMQQGHLSTPGWEAHADDFVLPPYSEDEMMGRIRLLLFRKRHIEASDTLKVSDVTLDLASGRVYDPSAVDCGLTPREFDLIRFLAVHRGKFFPRDRLLDMVWGVDFDGGERTVDIHIRRLRAKLPRSVGDLIETRRGIGYGLLSET